MVIPEKVAIDTASVQETNVNTQEEQLSYKNDFLKIWVLIYKIKQN